MLKLLIPVIVVLALASGGFYLYQTSRPKPVTQETAFEKPISPSPTLPAVSPQASPAIADACEVLTKGSADVPPVYSDIQWQQPQMTEHEIREYDKDYNLNSKMSKGCLIKSQKTTSEVTGNLWTYYMNKLDQYGWRQVDGADGVTGSMVTYKKNKRYFVIDEHPEPRFPEPGTSLPTQPPPPIVELFYGE